MADELVAHELFPPTLAAPIAGALAPSPYNFEFTGQDSLRLTVNNSQTGVRVAVNYRVNRPENPSHASGYTFTPTSDRAANTFEFDIGTGYLLNVSVFASAGAPRRAQTYVRLQVIRGRGASAIVLGTIAQGYVTESRDLAWPGSPLENSIDGDGYMRLIIGTDPAVGQEWSESVPAGARWELLTAYAQLVTSAAVADRRPGLLFDGGGPIYFRSPGTDIVQASRTLDTFWSQGSPFLTAILTDVAIANLPQRLFLQAGHRVFSNTNNLQAGDDYSSPRLAVREWLEV